MNKIIGRTNIDWCKNPDGSKGYVYNPVWGCLNNCPYCYARDIAKRFYKSVLKGWDKPAYDFKPIFMQSNFEKSFPEKPSTIFVNSMSDIAYWQNTWVDNVLSKISFYKLHNFLFLTKDPQIYNKYIWPTNCWFGVTITTQKQMKDAGFFEDKDFIGNHLFFSVEPILEKIDLEIRPDWLIVGAETGNRKEKVIPKKEWISHLLKDALRYSYPIFMKESLRGLMGTDFIQQFPREIRQ